MDLVVVVVGSVMVVWELMACFGDGCWNFLSWLFLGLSYKFES